VGSEGYAVRAKRECRALIEQLRRTLGPEPGETYFSIKSNPHDFGSYYEVVYYCESENPDSVRYALDAEAKLPREWDDIALAVLGLKVK